MKNSKMSLAIALLMLFILACTCGKKYEYGEYNSNNSNKSNNSNSSNDNKSSDNKNSAENKNGSTTSSTESTGIEECDAYIKAMDQYLNCPGISESAREDWRKKRAEMIEQVQEAKDTDYGKQLMVTVCKQGEVALRKNIETSCK